MSHELKNTAANPGPLGLLGFGMTTTLLNLHNAGFLPLSIAIVAMGIALGGLAQILAGIREMRQGNTFGGTAFTAYGLFFTFFMFIGTLKHNRATQVVFGSLTILFVLLALGHFTESHMIERIAGIEGIFCGLSAIYSAMGQIINAEYGRDVMPL